MSPFRLSGNTMTRLRLKFEEFQNARRTVRKNIELYITDYINFQGTPEARREALGDKYRRIAPQMSHLILNDSRNILWHREDIALMMGRDESSVSKVIKRIERSPAWCSRLEALREESKSGNNNIIPVYHEEIFGLIFDKYEEEYLERFTNPRRGNAPDAQEVLRFWDYLKASGHDSLNLIDAEYGGHEDFADILPMSWTDAIMLVFRRVLTAKTAYVLTPLLLLCYGLARRWSALVPVFTAVSAVTFISCVVLLKLRKFRASLLAAVGAVAVSMAAMWGLASFSGGKLYTPGGTVLNLNTKEHTLTLSPELWGKGHIVFMINADNYDTIKEIFCRVNNKGGYVSTGFNYHSSPNIILEPEITGETLTLEVKYTDIDGIEHGAFTFSYDVGKLRFEASKNFILYMQDSWLFISRTAGSATVYASISYDYADDVVECLYYGINKDDPDTMFIPVTGDDVIFSGDDDGIKYVSSYLVFRDGTKSETRRAE